MRLTIYINGRFHSLHHTQFRTNYSLFMPMYDYIYGTNDKSSDSLYETSLDKEEEKPDAIHLTHLTSLDSIYHLRLGFASLSSHPLSSRCYLFLMRPFTHLLSVILTSFSSRTFVFERNHFRDLTLHSHLLPKFSSHVSLFSSLIFKHIHIYQNIPRLLMSFSCQSTVYVATSQRKYQQNDRGSYSRSGEEGCESNEFGAIEPGMLFLCFAIRTRDKP